MKYPKLNRQKSFGIVCGIGEAAVFEQDGNQFLANGNNVKDPTGENVLEIAVPADVSAVNELTNEILELRKQVAALKSVEAPPAPPEEVTPITLNPGTPDPIAPLNLETCTREQMKEFLNATGTKFRANLSLDGMLQLCKEVNNGLESD